MEKTYIKYWNGNGNITTKKLLPDEKIGGFSVTEGHLDLNNRLSNNDLAFLGSDVQSFESLRDAMEVYKSKFNEYEKKSFDWKGHSAGALKFYWDNGHTEVLTYLKLNYKGNEISELDFELFNF